MGSCEPGFRPFSGRLRKNTQGKSGKITFSNYDILEIDWLVNEYITLTERLPVSTHQIINQLSEKEQYCHKLTLIKVLMLTGISDHSVNQKSTFRNDEKTVCDPLHWETDARWLQTQTVKICFYSPTRVLDFTSNEWWPLKPDPLWNASKLCFFFIRICLNMYFFMRICMGLPKIQI